MKSNGPRVFAALVVLLIGGCARPAESAKSANAAPAEKHYALYGEIIAVEAARNVLIVKHEAVEDYMPAMTMEFLVSAGDMANAKPGQRIRAAMIPSAKGDFRLEKIWPDDRAADAAVAAGANALRQDTMIRGRGVYREVGEQLPDFALYDQTGKVVQSARFRGKEIMINFIFTRCPVATMCPAATMKMMATQKLAKAADVKNLELISITLDPAYDTPGVLKEYADARGIDTGNFSFLTGPEDAIKDLLAQFGVIAEFKGDLLTHTLTTLLINEKGRIIHRADGSAWEPRDFVAKMHRG
ncbi:MAG: SCO family protein [Opitutaceae bacterium]|nr:SCO family protein [Opitutaceae bacterium]MBP9912325.1 SCO family protein [Opitutaceae bacterium]